MNFKAVFAARLREKGILHCKKRHLPGCLNRIMTYTTKSIQPLGGSAIAHVANLCTQRRLTDALEYIESCGLHSESALAPFGIIGKEVA